MSQVNSYSFRKHIPKSCLRGILRFERVLLLHFQIAGVKRSLMFRPLRVSNKLKLLLVNFSGCRQRPGLISALLLEELPN